MSVQCIFQSCKHVLWHHHMSLRPSYSPNKNRPQFLSQIFMLRTTWWAPAPMLALNWNGYQIISWPATAIAASFDLRANSRVVAIAAAAKQKQSRACMGVACYFVTSGTSEFEPETTSVGHCCPCVPNSDIVSSHETWALKESTCL